MPPANKLHSTKLSRLGIRFFAAGLHGAQNEQKQITHHCETSVSALLLHVKKKVLEIFQSEQPQLEMSERPSRHYTCRSFVVRRHTAQQVQLQVHVTVTNVTFFLQGSRSCSMAGFVICYRL